MRTFEFCTNYGIVWFDAQSLKKAIAHVESLGLAIDSYRELGPHLTVVERAGSVEEIIF